MLRPNAITAPVITQKLSSFEILKSYDKLLTRDKEIVNDEINNTKLKKLFYGKTWYMEDTIFIRIVDNPVVSEPNFVDIKLSKEEYNSDNFRDIIKKKLNSFDIKFLANGFQISKPGLYKTRNGKKAFISFVWQKGDCEYTEDGYMKDFVNQCIGVIEGTTHITKWNIEDGKVLGHLMVNGNAEYDIIGELTK